MKILCLDAGSSSLKFAAYRAEAETEPVRIAVGDAPPSANAQAALEQVLSQVQKHGDASLTAIGHRIVFGGPQLTEPTPADDGVLQYLETLVEVEPLHLRAELDLVYAVRRVLPSLLQVLCFDTAFHRRSPAIARRLPLPPDIDPLIQRYGFHGLSYEYITSQLRDDAGRTVIAHLGSGASLCALEKGAPIDTTMGFSALGGLMMGTRPGDLDPGIVLRLLGADSFGPDRLRELLYYESGLRGLSGSTGDMKTLIADAATDARAREAVELFVYQLVKHLGAMIAVLGGLKTLVFTGGIGEHAPSVRTAACKPFDYLGLRLDEEANRRDGRLISRPESSVSVEVIPTDENLMIARHTLGLMKKIS